MAEKGNDVITIYKDGKELEVTRKAYNIHYAARGYKLEQEKQVKVYTIEELQSLTEKELQKVKVDEYKAAFDAAEIQYEDDAIKAELIQLIPSKE